MVLAIALSLDALLVVFFTLLVLRKRRRSTAATLAWILSLILLPFGGPLLYMLIGYRNLERRIRRKPDLSRKLEFTQEPQIRFSPPEGVLDDEVGKISHLGKALTSFGPITGNRVLVLEDALKTYQEISTAVAEAKHHVHFEYYIFQPDETGAHFRDLLIQKAKSGVECRLLVDQIGSFGLNQKFIAPMIAAGIRFAFFGPVQIARPWGFHLRNHRKIVIIDGETGFIGSQNIGNEYIRWNHRRLSWRDTQIRIDGPAVAQLQTIFLEDWDFTTREKQEHAQYYPSYQPRGGSCVQTLPTGPDEQEAGLEMILISMIHSANHRITMVTPYLIPSPSILVALEAAAIRGVLVEFLVPKRSDQWVIDQVRRSWYREILVCGVKIYEYERSMVHAKVVTIDQRVGLIGSANMDERSFRINYESSLLIYDATTIAQLVTSFDAMKSQSQAVDGAELEKQFFLHDIRDGLFRVLSPLL